MSGIVATGNLGERCLVTSTIPMLDHLVKTDSQGGEDYPRLAERREFQALSLDSQPGANLLLWIDPDGAEEALRKRAADHAEFALETVGELLLKVKLDDGRFQLSLRANVAD